MIFFVIQPHLIYRKLRMRITASKYAPCISSRSSAIVRFGRKSALMSMMKSLSNMAETKIKDFLSRLNEASTLEWNKLGRRHTQWRADQTPGLRDERLKLKILGKTAIRSGPTNGGHTRLLS